MLLLKTLAVGKEIETRWTWKIWKGGSLQIINWHYIVISCESQILLFIFCSNQVTFFVFVNGNWYSAWL